MGAGIGRWPRFHFGSNIIEKTVVLIQTFILYLFTKLFQGVPGRIHRLRPLLRVGGFDEQKVGSFDNSRGIE